MDVEHGLSAVLAGIDHAAETRFVQTFLPGNPRARVQQMPHQWCIVRLEIRQAGDMPAGNHQNMGGGLRIDVPERKDLLVLVDLVRRNLAGQYAAEQTIIRHDDTPSLYVLLFSTRFYASMRGIALPMRRVAAVILLLVWPALLQAQQPAWYDYHIVDRHPHRSSAFTQGLLFHDGELYEGTGRYGRSGVARLDLEAGRILAHRALPPQYFGEGIAIAGDRLYQLTWRENLVFVYDAQTLEPITSQYHPGEGWGLTWNGELLILSDGSDTLQFIRPDDFRVVRRLSVTRDGQPLHRLNELEYIDGEIWANVWMSDRIVRIDPDSGRVVAVVDLAGLRQQTEASGSDAVLNGIAWDASQQRLLVTGKLWSDIFEIELRPRDDNDGA